MSQPRLSRRERQAVLDGSAHDASGYYVCWACGLSTKEPYVKRRVDHGPHHGLKPDMYGVYHRLCKPRRDDKTEVPFHVPPAPALR